MNRFFSVLLFIFCVAFLNSCTKEYSREIGTNSPAEASLWDSTGTCLPDSVYGTYYTGVTPGSDTAFVAIQVNVTKTGSYSIITEPENGLTFFDSGYFTTTGINVIHLKPIGTPIIITTSSFDFGFDSSFCSFNVTVIDSTGTGLGGQPDTTGTTTSNDSLGTWQFTETGNFSGIIDSTSYVQGVTPEDSSFIYLRGHTITGDTSFYISFFAASSTLTGDTYTVGSDHLLFQLNNNVSASIIYLSTPAIIQTNDFAVNISSYDSNTGIIACTFMGLTQNSAGNIVSVDSGSFTARLQ